MVAPTAPPRRMTLSEFLAWDDGTDTRYELYEGEVVAMAPPAEAHGAIVLKLGALIDARLKPGCRAIADGGIVPKAGRDSYYVADIVVKCGPPTPEARFIQEPVLVVEVLSPSTADNDQNVKAPDFRRMPSVREVLLVHSRRRYAQLWRQEGGEWVARELLGEVTLQLDALTSPLPLGDVYAAGGI